MYTKIEYFHKDKLCSIITFNEEIGFVKVKNFTDNLLDRAFGNNESPILSDFENFLEKRCFLKGRPHMKETLRSLGLDLYEPVDIVYVTHGVMPGDFYWLRFDDQKEITWSKDILPMYPNLRK